MSELSKGLGWVMLAGLSFVVFIVIVRYVGTNLHPVQAAFLRYALGLVVLAPLFLRQGVALLHTRYPLRHAIRGCLHALGVMLWFFAIARLPIAEATALGFTAPIFVVLGAVFFLGERLTLVRLLCLLIGLAGVLLITRPGLVAIDLGAVAVLLSAPLFATSKLLVKFLVRADSSATTVAYLSIYATLTMLVPAMLVWQAPSLAEMALLLGAALFATLSHLCIARGLALIDVGVAQPVEFLQLVWSALFGLVLFGEMPTLWVWAGAAVIVFAASVNARQEALAQRARARHLAG